jgi:hypothetical protein
MESVMMPVKVCAFGACAAESDDRASTPAKIVN